jgi:2-hydroxy-6-oxonona-2,4-dienedioate hydrolase
VTESLHTVTVRGVPWAWREAGAGWPLVLLHGGGGTGKAFTHQLAGLSDRFRVLAPDLPGFGKTPWVPGVRTVDQLGPVLLEWLEALALKRVTLGGNSMGGRVALAAALRAPTRIAHLVLLDAVGVVLSDVPVLNPLTVPPSQFVPTLVHDPEHYRQVTPYRTLEDAQELQAGRASFARYLEEGPIGPDRSADLPRLHIPTLLIWGRHARVVPLPYGQALARLLPEAELTVIDNAGHLPHIEAADLVNHLIRDFVDRHPPGPA